MKGQLVLGLVYWLGVVTCGSPPQPQATSCPVPLLVVDTQVDSNRRKVTLTLQNTGTKVVTAWHVTIVSGTEPGAAHGGYGIDAFRQLEGLGPGDGYIVPEGTVTRAADLPLAGNPAVVVAVPDTAVFADTSFCGDRRDAEFVFEGRRAQLEAWKEIAGELEKVRRNGDVHVENLEGLLSVMDESIARRGPDIVRQTFRANLSLRVADVRGGRRQALPTVTEFLEEASRNIAAATVHIPR